jgi:hypothetical protein
LDFLGAVEHAVAALVGRRSATDGHPRVNGKAFGGLAFGWSAESVAEEFSPLSREMPLPYQTLMNMYLRDCAETGKRPHWSVPSTPKRANKPMQRRRDRRTRRRDIGVESSGQFGGGLAAPI